MQDFDSSRLGLFALFSTAIDFSSSVNRNHFALLFLEVPGTFRSDIRARFEDFDAWRIGLWAMFITSVDLHSSIN
jgi:hypothetical protein